MTELKMSNESMADLLDGTVKDVAGRIGERAAAGLGPDFTVRVDGDGLEYAVIAEGPVENPVVYDILVNAIAE